MNHYESILNGSNTIQIRKSSLKGLIPTLQVKPQSDLGVISQLKSDMTRKHPPTLPDIIP